MSAPEASGRGARVVTVGAVLLVAAVAAVVSYVHMATLAREAGEGWRALLLPLSVDGLVVAASMTLVTRRRAGLPGGGLAWCALLGGVGASLAANIAAAEPTVTARLVASWPALAFAVAFELLLQQRRGAVVRAVEVVPDHPDHAGPVADHRPDQTGPAPDQTGPAAGPAPNHPDRDVPGAEDLLAALDVPGWGGAGWSGEVDHLPDQHPDQTGPLDQEADQTGPPVPNHLDDDPTLLADLRRWAADQPDQPSRNAVMGRFGIGTTRANRLLDGLPRSGTGSGADHGPDHAGPAADHRPVP